MMRIFISGPMTGYENFNYPAFNAAATKLRFAGHHVENPAENPAPACGSWVAYMELSLAQLVTCNAIVLLPGWEQSKGARLEYAVARAMGLKQLELP